MRNLSEFDRSCLLWEPCRFHIFSRIVNGAIKLLRKRPTHGIQVTWLHHSQCLLTRACTNGELTLCVVELSRTAILNKDLSLTLCRGLLLSHPCITLHIIGFLEVWIGVLVNRDCKWGKLVGHGQKLIIT